MLFWPYSIPWISMCFVQGEREVGFSQNQGTNIIMQNNKNLLTLDKKIMHHSGSILINLFQNDIFWPFTVPFKYHYIPLLVLFKFHWSV
jgi:hypothetical protein